MAPQSHRLNVNTAKYIGGAVVLSTGWTIYSLRCRSLDRLAEDGTRPVVMPRHLPGHFTKALRAKPVVPEELEDLSGLSLIHI